jgi:signal transduction histidine kinase
LTTTVAGAAWLAVAGIAASGIGATVELPVRDLILKLLPARPATQVIAVVIDDESLRVLGPWPWSRSMIADLVRRVGASTPRALALDMLLSDARPGDDELAAALASTRAVLAAAPLPDRGAWALPAPRLSGSAALAHATFELDHDGVMRRLVATKQAGGLALPALAIAAIKQAKVDWPVPVGQVLRPDFRTPVAAIPIITAAAVLAGRGTDGLRGKIVMLGVTAIGLGDRVITPTSRGSAPDPGVLVHAATVECLLRGGLLHRAAPAISATLAALLAAGALQLRRVGGRRHVAAVLALVVVPGTAGAVALALGSVELPLVSLTAVVLGTVGLVELQLFLSMYARTGAAADVMALDLGEQRAAPKASPEARLATLEAMATALTRRRADDRAARRMVAHELKTPLTSVRGLTQLLAEFDLSPEEARRVAGMAAAEADRLQRMVEGLLDLERLALKSFTDSSEVLELGKLAAVRADVLAAGSARVVDARVATNVSVRGDRELLERVVDNLVGNAFKFSPPAAPVQLVVERRGDRGILEISDAGPGIAAEERKKVFHRFFRGAVSEATPGLGLGLALVAEVVAWHGGTVELDSTEGMGTTFRVLLPLAGALPKLEE